MHTYARVARPSSSTRTRCRFGLNRRFVATIEWLRLFPKPGFFPQMAHTLDMRPSSVPVSIVSAGGGGAQVREHVCHLERTAHGLGALFDPGVRLLDAIEREDAE